LERVVVPRLSRCWFCRAFRAVVTWRAHKTLVRVGLTRFVSTESSGGTRVARVGNTGWAIVALITSGGRCCTTAARGTSITCLAVIYTHSVQSVSSCSFRAGCVDTILAVCTKRTRRQSEVFSALNAVVTRWTSGAGIRLAYTALFYTEVASRARVLHTSLTVIAARAAQLTYRELCLFRTQITVWTRCARGFSPVTVSLVRAHLNAIVGSVDLVAGRYRRAVSVSFFRVVVRRTVRARGRTSEGVSASRANRRRSNCSTT
jgi:hypothetical protein